MGIRSSKPQKPIPTYVVPSLPSSTSDNLTLQATHQGEPCEITFTLKDFVEISQNRDIIESPIDRELFYDVLIETVIREKKLWTVQIVPGHDSLTELQDYVLDNYRATENGILVGLEKYKRLQYDSNKYKRDTSYPYFRKQIKIQYATPDQLLHWITTQNITEMPHPQNWTFIKRVPNPNYEEEKSRIENIDTFGIERPKTKPYRRRRYRLRFV